MVRSTFVTDWRLATSPTRTSPFFAKATIDGVVRAPSALAITVASPPSSTDTQELVVPRSIPTALAIFIAPKNYDFAPVTQPSGRVIPKYEGARRPSRSRSTTSAKPLRALESKPRLGCARDFGLGVD